jgi:hypothetical protein
VFKLVMGALALLAGLLLRSVGRTYGAVGTAFDARAADDAAEQARLRGPETVDDGGAGTGDAMRPRTCVGKRPPERPRAA